MLLLVDLIRRRRGRLRTEDNIHERTDSMGRSRPFFFWSPFFCGPLRGALESTARAPHRHLSVRPVRPRMGVLGPRLENIGADLLDTRYHSVARL